MPLSEYTIIRIYWPIYRLDDPFMEKLENLLETHQPVGVIGHYKRVMECADGQETFFPLDTSWNKPEDLHQQTYKTTRITTYAPANCEEKILSSFIDNVAKIHPWENPVIEVYKKNVFIYVPPAKKGN